MKEKKVKKQKSSQVGRKYNKLGSLVWAMKRLWKIDRAFVFFIFAMIPVNVIYPLVQSYFAKVLIDRIGLGAQFGELAAICVAFTTAILIFKLLSSFINSRCRSRQYTPTSIVQGEMYTQVSYETDFENTEKQDFEELFGYAVGDAQAGDCSLEWVWEDIFQMLNNTLGIVTYASLLVFINPVIFGIVAVVAVLSYFTTRWQTVYYEKHKHEWEKKSVRPDICRICPMTFPWQRILSCMVWRAGLTR